MEKYIRLYILFLTIVNTRIREKLRIKNKCEKIIRGMETSTAARWRDTETMVRNSSSPVTVFKIDFLLINWYFSVSSTAIYRVTKQLTRYLSTYSFWIFTGTKQIIECHGSMWKLRCSYCGHLKADYHIPLTPALDPHGYDFIY